ncbi:MAG: IS630 family transposase, partial [Thermoplasmataceae archaeon]
MVFERTKPHIVLNPKQKSYLERIAKSGKSEKREHDRARIILMDAEGKGVNTIARELHTNRTKIYLTIDKALSFGVEKAIKDLSGRGKKRT